MTHEEQVKIARDKLALALKKLGTSGSGKGSGGYEDAYAFAAKTLADLDPTFVLPRKKYRKV